MTDLIPRDAAIDRLTELSCDDNAHWGAIIDALRAIPAIDPAAIREAALKDALKAIADLPHGKNEDVMEGDERSYRAIEALIGKKK